MRANFRLCAVLFSALSTAACGHAKSTSNEPASAAEAASDTGQATSKEVAYDDGEAKLKGFIVYPKDVSTPRPAVLVVHEWWGLNEHARTQARRLADLGYVAMAIDMYGEGKQASHPDDAKKFMMEVMSNLVVGERRFKAAKQVLVNDPRVDADKIAAVGYCFGGAVVLHMARTGEDLDVAASIHGNLATQAPMEKGKFNGKIFVATGGADPFVPPEQVATFRKEMEAAGASFDIVEYAGVKHAFTNPDADRMGQEFNLPLGYSAEADQGSWQKLSEELSKAFGS
jgi:dienelactone hydrolase